MWEVEPANAIRFVHERLPLLFGKANPEAVVQILLVAAMVLRFYEELRGRQLTTEMAAAASATARVLRSGAEAEIDSRSVVLGDVVLLSAGDLIPGDVRILESNNLFVG